MKLQRSTLILLLLALTLGTGVLIYEHQRANQAPNQPQAGQANVPETPLYTFKEDQVQALKISLANQQILEFERSAQGKPTAWLMKAPKAMPANDASVAFLLSLMATGTSEQTLEVEPAQIKDFGLDAPTATVEVTLKDKRQHKLTLGKPTFDQRSLYAQVDPSMTPTGTSPTKTPQPKLRVQLVSTNFANAVNRPLADWQQPKPDQPNASPTIPLPNTPIPPVPQPSQP